MNPSKRSALVGVDGGHYRVRTCDPYHVKVVTLGQLPLIIGGDLSSPSVKSRIVPRAFTGNRRDEPEITT